MPYNNPAWLTGSSDTQSIKEGADAANENFAELALPNKAALRDVQTSPTDTTVGRLLAVGAFGNGDRIFVGSGSIDDLKDVDARYLINSDVSGTPFPGIWWVDVYASGSTGHAQQILTLRNDDSTQYKRRWNGSAWGSYVIVYDTSNIIGTVSQNAGKPTGNLFETGSGSGDDFSYRYNKIADGTVEFWGALKATFNDAESLRGNFSLPFSTTGYFSFSFTPDVISPSGISDFDLPSPSYNRMMLGTRNNGGTPTNNTRIGIQVSNDQEIFVSGNYLWCSFYYKSRWF